MTNRPRSHYEPLRSLRSADPNDPGYVPRARLKARLDQMELGARDEQLDAGGTDTADYEELFAIYLRDVLDQYTTLHYGDEDPGHITTLIERLSLLAPRIFNAMDGRIKPTPTTIEALFDDFIDLDGDIFCGKYGLDELYQLALEHRTPTPPPSHYEELAEFLSPGDPSEGRRRIDTVILANLHAEASRANRLTYLSMAVTMLVTTLASAGALKFMMMLKAYPPDGPFTALVNSISAPIALVFIASWLAGLYVSFLLQDRRMELLPEEIPSDIAAWLHRHDRHHGLRYWREIHWPWIKQAMHRRDLVLFTYWKRVPHPREDYEELLDKRPWPFSPWPSPYHKAAIRNFLTANPGRYP